LSAARFTEALKGLQRVNAVTQSARLTWPDLRAAASAHPDRAIRVLVVACGGDVLIAKWRKAQPRRLRA
jgi:hypothetical protein